MSPILRRGAAARRHNAARRQFLQLEQLEDRTVLAGNVFAIASGGYLQLIGDAGDNQLEVTRVGSTSVQVSSLDGTTTINGSTSTKTFTNITNGVLAVTGNGDDVLELSGSSTDLFRVFATTSINTGAGNDIVRFTNYSNWGALAVITGGGDDQVYSQLDPNAPQITVGGLRVAGPAVINTGAGNDLISLRNSTFQSNAIIDGSTGDDTIDIRATAFQRITSIYGNSGLDTLNSVGNTFRYPPFLFSLETQTSISGPSAGNDTLTVAEEGTATVSVLDNDIATSGTIDVDSVAIVTPPLRGEVEVNADGTITYTHNGAELSTDVFTYTVLDSQGNISNVATVNVIVTPVNDPPIAGDNTFTVNEGATATLNLGANDTDAEGRLNLNSIQIVTQPENGTVTVGANGNVTYVNDGSTATSDSFTYTIADLDGGVSTAATVTINITPQNDAPTIGAIANVSTDEDTATGAIAVTVNDEETPAGSLTVTATSSNTTLVPNANIVVGGSGSNRTLTITPAANLSGTTTITVTATDANNLSTTRQFQLTVNAQNDPPTITAVGDVTVNEDTATTAIPFSIGDVETAVNNLTITTLSSDTDVVANTGISIGGSGANRTVTVTPVANASGSSLITINVSDGTTTTSETFLVTVNAENDLPTITTIEDTTVAAGATVSPFSFTIGDVETDPTALTVTATSDNQTVVNNSGLSFTGTGASRALVVAPTGTSGSANITVRVTDAEGDFVEETFALEVNAAPTIGAVADQTINEEGTTGALTFTVGDTETPVANLQVSATSSNTVLVPIENIVFSGSGANRTVTVTPVTNVSGSSIITLTVTDGNNLTATEQFTVNVTEVNDFPTISTIADINVNEDAAIAPFNITVGDVENLAGLTFTVTSDNTALIANNGVSISGSGATRTVAITQVPNASGTANITILVDDGNGGTVSETFAVNVQAQNDLPIAGNASATVFESGSVLIDLGAVSSDVEGALNLATGITITQAPANGMLTLNGDGTVTYTHDDSETISDLFRYTISDAQGAVSAEATVNITVTPVNDLPVVTIDFFNLTFDDIPNVTNETRVSVSGNILDNDTDADSPRSALRIASTTSGSMEADGSTDYLLTYGTLTLNADGTFEFEIDPAALEGTAGVTIPLTVGYEVTDGIDSGFGTFTINIMVI